jgi:hypothetical protein
MATRCCMYVYTYIPHAPDRSGSTVATSNCTPQSVSIFMSVARRNVSGLRPRRARFQIHRPTTARPLSPARARRWQRLSRVQVLALVGVHGEKLDIGAARERAGGDDAQHQ